MAQYFRAVLLTDSGAIDSYLTPSDYDNGQKLTEHSWIGNDFVDAVEQRLTMPKRVVWAGTHADGENGGAANLCRKTQAATKAVVVSYLTRPRLQIATPAARFVINHDKRLVVDKHAVAPSSDGRRLHPLPLLAAEGNNRGGGDLRPTDLAAGDYTLVGTWARDHISAGDAVPEGYSELRFDLVFDPQGWRAWHRDRA